MFHNLKNILPQKMFWSYSSKTGYQHISQSTKRFTSNIKESSNKTFKNNVLGPRMCNPTNFDKWILVWMKKYKSTDEVPHEIRQEFLYQTKSRARIKCANYMIGLTIIGCIIAVYTGKARSERGESIQKSILEFNKGIKKDVAD